MNRAAELKIALQMFWDSIYGCYSQTDLVMIRFIAHAYYRAGHLRIKDYVRVMKWTNKREVSL